MSYAGPASRGRRAPNLHLAASQPSLPAASGRMLAYSRPRASDRDRTLAFAAGIVLGLTAGAGLALLFAPQSGADTRRAILRTGRSVRRRSHDAWDDLRDELRDFVRRRKRARLARRNARKDCD